ncbi:hypothetical protein ACKFKF_15850 [Phormidesmis sp. 146-12]
MPRSILFSLAWIAIAMIPLISTTSSAQSTSSNPPAATTIPVMSPYDLVFMAYQGYFRSQGLRGYGTFTDGCNQGKIQAKDVVDAAIKANQLPPDILSDRGYMSAVDANLKAFKNNSGR